MKPLHDGFMSESVTETASGLVERRRAPAFDVGVMLLQTWRSYGSGKTAQMRVPVWSLQELLVRGQLDAGDKTARTTARTKDQASGVEKTVVSDICLLYTSDAADE